MDLIKILLKLTFAGALSLSALLALGHYWSDIESYLSSNTYVHLSCLETKIESTSPRFQSRTIVKIAKNKESDESDIDDSKLIQWPLSLLEGSVEDALKSYPEPKRLWAASRGPLKWLLGDSSSVSDTTYRFNIVSGYRDDMDIVIDRTNLSFNILEEYWHDSCSGHRPRQAQILRDTGLCGGEMVKRVPASGTCEIIPAEEYALIKDKVLDRYSEMKKLQAQISEARKAVEEQLREKQELEAREAQNI